jgi:hypothetical protein
MLINVIGAIALGAVVAVWQQRSLVTAMWTSRRTLCPVRVGR